MKTEKPVYYVSARPEAYEIWGEVGREEARQFGQLIAEQAGRRFPNIEFRVDDIWHEHLPGMELVAAYIDGHWQAWAAESGTHSRAA
jgi:hypothetical protein